MRVRSALVALALWGAGCGNDSNVTLGASSAEGSVGGVVLDATPGFPPLANANVTVIAGGNTFMATTDMNGTFSVKSVPSGNVVVRVSSDGHFDAWVTGTLASAAGNFPVNNASLTVGPIVAVSNKGQLAVRLVNDSGAPAANVTVTVRVPATWLDLGPGTPTPRGGTEAGGKSDASGLVSIAGIPDYASIGPVLPDSVQLNIPPQPLSGTAGYSFLGLTLTIAATQYSAQLGQTPTLVLAGPHSALAVLSSNIDWLETGGPGPTGSQVSGPVTVAFNQAISGGSLRVTLLTETGAIAQAMPMPTVTGNLLSVGFSKALDAGTRYNIAIHAESAYATDQPHQYDAVGPFFVPQSQGTPVQILSNTSRIDPNSPNDFIVVFSEPVGLGLGRQDQVPCVVFYDTSLDGDLNTTSPGEYTMNGNNLLKCGNLPALFMRPAEASFGSPGGSPITGFTSTWKMTVKPPPCYNGYQCTISGNPVHFVFSRQNDPNYIMKRSDGTPLPDLSFDLPQFQ